mgnify:FL=1
MKLFKKAMTRALGLSVALLLSASVYAESSDVLEEIIVTARQQSETLQDVPVTIAALTEADLDRYNITSLVDAAKMIPNMVVAHGGSGNGSTLRLRGIGSSSISAAFDQSMAINIDGIVVNRGRFIHNSYMDMRQLEVLKGPQSLYFGKSATAGVVSITTNDPGDEFEFEIMAGVETEHEGNYAEMVISGPLSDTFGARFAIGASENDEMFENYSFSNDPAVANGSTGATKWLGDESLNARLTLVWEPTDNFKAKLKYNYSEYDNNGGGTMWTEEFCREPTKQPTAIPAASFALALFAGVDDCKINGNTSHVDLVPALRNGLPDGADNGKAYLDQETDMISLTLDWDFHENYSLTSVTGWVDLEHWELDDYSYSSGVFGGLHNNVYESFSQEFRIASNLDGPFNFQAGLFYQEIEQEFNAFQYAFNLGAIFGPDPVTGWEYDYNKNHSLDTEVMSAFFAGYWDVNDRMEITAGLRWTDEEKDGHIEIPYMHAFAAAFGFGAPSFIGPLEFDDDDVSPEVAVNYYLNDDVSVYLAYKEGFKSGGIDNSALPTAALNDQDPNFNGYGFLVYDSETAEGFELGMKGNFLNGAMRLNATAFTYEYTDLQVQLFDSAIIQFQTFNASALETQGIEFDMLWNTDVEGLSIRSAWAWTETEYSEDFINATGQNLKGSPGAGNAEITGFVGATFDRSLNENWRFSISADARFTDDYAWTATLNPFEQDSFWTTDAAIRVYSEDGKYEVALIGRNIGDEIYIIGGGAQPGGCPNVNPALGPGACDLSGTANDLDQAATTPLGRTVSLQFRYRL